jgi:hypothetical protein
MLTSPVAWMNRIRRRAMLLVVIAVCDGGFHPTWLFCTNMPVIQRNRLHLQRCRISDYFSVVFMAHSLRWLHPECLSRNRQ